MLRKDLWLALAAATTLSTGAALAQTGDEILKAKGCLGCHGMEKKKVGPAFNDIAAKGKANAEKYVAKIKDAQGHPKVNASEAEIKAAVDAVLSKK